MIDCYMWTLAFMTMFVNLSLHGKLLSTFDIYYLSSHLFLWPGSLITWIDFNEMNFYTSSMEKQICNYYNLLLFKPN